MLPPLAQLVAVALSLATPVPASDALVLERGIGGSGVCATNLHGLGICQSEFQLCPGPGGACDATTPCADGLVCTVGSGCASALAGVCLVAFTDGGCSNPGTAAGGYESCDPVLFHEDFKPLVAGAEGSPPPGLHQMAVTAICGSGSSMFENESCAATVGASSPRETARWGVALNCAAYATADHRVVATTGEIDISGCAGAELDFDYLLALQQGGRQDRTFVTASVDGGLTEVIATNQVGTAQAFTTSELSCAGTVLPIGTLIQDGAWHHYRAGIGSGSSVEVAFWAETIDGVLNTGQGWFFDDVRIDCGIRVFGDGFEGANRLRWSSSIPPSPPVEVQEPGSCGTYAYCAGPDADCGNFTSFEGPTYCLNDFYCLDAAPCPGGSGDCPAGQVCVVDSCCGTPRCTLATCDPIKYKISSSEATAASARF